MADDPLHEQLRRDTTGPRRRLRGHSLPISCGVLRCWLTYRGLVVPRSGPRKATIAFSMMSALPPKADMCGAKRHVRFGPKADIGDLLERAKVVVEPWPLSLSNTTCVRWDAS